VSAVDLTEAPVTATVIAAARPAPDRIPAPATATSAQRRAAAMAELEVLEHSGRFDLSSYEGVVPWRTWRREHGIDGEQPSEWAKGQVADFMRPMGFSSKDEMVPFVPFDRSGPFLRRVRSHLGFTRRIRRPAVLAAVDTSEAALAAAAPPLLRELPETRFDVDNREEFEPIHSNQVARILSIQNEALRAMAAVYVPIHVSWHENCQQDSIVGDLEALEELCAEAGADFRDAGQLGAAVHGLLDRRYMADASPSCVLETASRAIAAREALLEYASEHPTVAPAMQAVIPPDIAADADLIAKLRKLASTLRPGHVLARKVDADDLSDNFVARQAAALQRSRQAVRFDHFARMARGELVRLRLSWIEFSYLEPVLDDRGQATGGVQRVVARAWDQRALRAENAAAPPGAGLDAPVGQHEPSPAVAIPDGLVVTEIEFVRVEGVTGTPSRPWFVDHSDACVHHAPAGLPPWLQERRRDLIIARNLPEPHRRPAGLLAPSGHAAFHLYAACRIANGRILVATVEVAHASLLAHRMFNLMSTTAGRIGEVLQFEDDPERVTSVVRGGFEYSCFLAVGKGRTEDEPYAVTDRSLNYMRTLKRFALGLRYGIGRYPVIAACQALTAKVEEGRFVFEVCGRHLQSGHVNFLFRHLMAGIRRLRSHDIRHACANRGGRLGDDDAATVRRLRLRKGSISVARSYKRPTEAERRELEALHLELRDEEEAAGVIMVKEPVSG